MIIFVSVLLLLGGCVAYVLWPRGHRSFVISDVSQPVSASVSSPLLPFGGGGLYVIVEGQLDGDAVLQVISSRGRDRREISLRGPQISFVEGSAEAWTGDLQVQYRPTTAQAGQLYVALYCGTGFTSEDYERYVRISRNKQ